MQGGDHLHIENLSKTYAGGIRALQDINLTIPPGMFGLLGPNGAGKSTLMRTIATLQEPDSGSIRLGSLDLLRRKDEARRLLGYLPQEFGLYPHLDAVTLLDHLARLKGVVDRKQRRESVEALLQRVNLWDKRKQKLGGYSGGMRQRFGIAQALLGNPRLIIVDEPTAGLDPEERNRFLNLLSEIGEEVVVLLSTHIVDDVAELCLNMAIIARGKLLRTGPPQQAIEELRGKTWKRIVAKTDLGELEREHTVISTRLVGGRTVVYVYADERPQSEFESAAPDLEQVYFTTLARAA